MAINPIGASTKAAQPQFTGAVDKVLGSKAFEKVAEFAGKNSATFNAASSLIMAGVLRPAAIMALPAKDEQAQKNKGNAAAHAIASAVIGFAITSVVMKPISAGLGKVMGNTEKYLPKLHEKMKANPAFEKNVNKVLSFGPDIILAVPRALLTSKLSKVISSKLFNKEKKGAAAPQPQQQQPQPQVQAQAQAPAPKVAAQPASERPVLDNFKGGNK